MTQALHDLGEYVSAALPQHVVSAGLVAGELIVEVRAAGIVPVLKFLRDDTNCQFKLLVDLCGVDYPEREERLEVVYNLLSLKHNQRIRLKVRTDEDTPVPTATGVFSTAGWFEREAWDLYVHRPGSESLPADW